MAVHQSQRYHWLSGTVLSVGTTKNARALRAPGRGRQATYFDVLVELGFVLPGQLLVLPLELGDEELPLELLLLLEGQELLLQLLLPDAGLRRGQRKLVVQAQVHGHRRGGHWQRQRRGHVHCGREHSTERWSPWSPQPRPPSQRATANSRRAHMLRATVHFGRLCTPSLNRLKRHDPEAFEVSIPRAEISGRLDQDTHSRQLSSLHPTLHEGAPALSKDLAAGPAAFSDILFESRRREKARKRL